MKRLFCGLLALLASASAHAAICTWTGASATTSNWSDAGNWDNCAGAQPVPNDTDTLIFPNAAARKTNSNDLVGGIGALRVRRLQFDSGGYDIDGNAISLAEGVTATIAQSTASTFRPNITLRAFLGTTTFQIDNGGSNGSAGMFFTGTLALGANDIIVNGTGPLVMTGDISGSGSLTKDNSGRLFLGGTASSYSGVTTINNGIVTIGSSAALGASGAASGTVVNSGAALFLQSNAAIELAEPLTLSGSGPNGNPGALFGSIGNHTVSGDIILAADATIGANTPGKSVTLSGVVGGAGKTLTKSGGGTLRLTNSNTHGGSNVVVGVLELSGATGSIGVAGGGTLAGDGVSSDRITLNGGALAPGPASGQRVGTLDAAAFTWFGKAAGFPAAFFQLGPTSVLSDHLVLAGDISKGASPAMFEFSDGATAPQPGVTYTLLTFTSVSGFVVGDFTFSYAGTGPGSSMSGTFNLTANELQFTPSAVTSDLIFRNDFE